MRWSDTLPRPLFPEKLAVTSVRTLPIGGFSSKGYLFTRGEGGKGWQSKQAIGKSENFPILFQGFPPLTIHSVFQSALLRPDRPYGLHKTVGILASAKPRMNRVPRTGIVWKVFVLKYWCNIFKRRHRIKCMTPSSPTLCCQT